LAVLEQFSQCNAKTSRERGNSAQFRIYLSGLNSVDLWLGTAGSRSERRLRELFAAPQRCNPSAELTG